MRVLHADQLRETGRLLVAADVNAVPPSGIEGVGSHDFEKHMLVRDREYLARAGTVPLSQRKITG